MNVFRTIYGALFFTLLTLTGATRQALAESRFAIAIGNNVGATSQEPLKWAETDAQNFSDVLEQLGGVPVDRQVVLLGKSIDELRLAFARLGGRIDESHRRGERTVLFVFFSGHADEGNLHVRGQVLPMGEFKSLIEGIPSSVSVTIVDACHSGTLVRGREKGAQTRPAFDISFARDVGPEGRVTITSAGTGEVAQESDDLQSSYFTHYLLSGLRGAADTNHDGQVTLEEAYEYVYNHTLSRSHSSTAAVQHPELKTKLAGEGRLALSHLDRSQGTLVLPSDLRGNLLVIDETNSRVVVEVEKQSAQPLRLALPAGRYRLQLRHEKEALLGQVSLPWGGEFTVREKDLRKTSLMAMLEKGYGAALSHWEALALFGVATPASDLRSQYNPFALGLKKTLDARWSARVMLQFGSLQAGNELWLLQNREFEFHAGLGYTWQKSPLTLTAWLGPALLKIDQRASRLDAARLPDPSVPAEENRSTWGAAAQGALELQLELRANVFLDAQFGARVLSFREENSPQVRRGLSGLAGIAWRFE